MGEYIVNFDSGELATILDMACTEAGFAREKIVRCRDCEFFYIEGRWNVCIQFSFETTDENMPDKFCGWGERKSNV